MCACVRIVGTCVCVCVFVYVCMCVCVCVCVWCYISVHALCVIQVFFVLQISGYIYEYGDQIKINCFVF